MNAPRFMKEYAAYTKRIILASESLDTKEKKNACFYLDGYVSAYEHGMLTLNDAMDAIGNSIRRKEGEK